MEEVLSPVDEMIVEAIFAGDIERASRLMDASIEFKVIDGDDFKRPFCTEPVYQ